METLSTPKEVFTYIRDHSIGKPHRFICHCLDALYFTGEINGILIDRCKIILNDHKPLDDSFTEHRYWHGGVSWWNFYEASYNEELEEVFEEKRRFLTYLIEKL